MTSERIERSGHGKCKTCNHRIYYVFSYDARYCPACNVWTEPRCSTRDVCEFCLKRPARPSDMEGYK